MSDFAREWKIFEETVQAAKKTAQKWVDEKEEMLKQGLCAFCGVKMPFFGRSCKACYRLKKKKGSLRQSKPCVAHAGTFLVTLAGRSWRILSAVDDKVLLLSEKVVGKRPIDSGLGVEWEYCSLRSYLNGEFFDSLGELKPRVIPTDVIDKTVKLSEKVFLLDKYDAQHYFNYEETNDAFGAGEDWWLKPRGQDKLFYERFVTADGYLYGNSTIYFQEIQFSSGVRPAVWVRL